MASLETKYLGLTLKSPVIVGSSPLTQNLVSLEKCKSTCVARAFDHALKCFVCMCRRLRRSDLLCWDCSAAAGKADARHK